MVPQEGLEPPELVLTKGLLYRLGYSDQEDLP